MRFGVLAIFLLAAQNVQAGELRLEITGKGLTGNQIKVGLYNVAEAFPVDEKAYRITVAEATGDSLSLSIKDIKTGRYAVAAYVDTNRNGKLDRNFFGVPQEAYGFSNNVRGMMGPPRFEEAAFEIGEGTVLKSVKLY